MKNIQTSEYNISYLNYIRYTDILSSPSGFTHLIFYSQFYSKMLDSTTERKSDYIFSKHYVVNGTFY